MVRTIAITAAVTAVMVSGLIIALALLMPGGGKGPPTSAPSTPAPALSVASSPAATAPAPVAITSGSPQFEQLLGCLAVAGYDSPKLYGEEEVIVSGKGVPMIRFKIDSWVSPITFTPATAPDIAVLRTAGCLS